MCYSVLLAVPAYRIDLIFHQCNKRTDDNGRAFACKGGKLVTQAFTPTGRHNHEGILTRSKTFNDGFLVSFKIAKTKKLF